MCFLDTHIIIWLYQKSLSLLSIKASECIEDNEVTSGKGEVVRKQVSEDVLDFCIATGGTPIVPARYFKRLA